MAQNQLAALLRDFAQGASNSAASTVSAPVDGIAWLLRKAGVPIPAEPVGGSDWMARQGLTAQPTNALAGAVGEFAGGVGPMVAAAKAPQIANRLLQMQANAAAPNAMNPQAGAIDINALKSQFPDVDAWLSQRGDRITLDRLVVPAEARGQGTGSRFMGALVDAADDDAARIGLTPSGDLGGNKARLVEFYKRFGFAPNKGRNRDFEFMETMVRAPGKKGAE